MDTSLVEFIKMCYKSEEIQRICRNSTFKESHKNSVHAYEDNSGEGWVIIFPYDDNVEWGSNSAIHRPHYCWLPTQDQLQAMIGTYDRCLEMLYWWKECGKVLGATDDYWGYTFDSFTSMEQLWLAFVMYELYQKSWNGEDWVKKGE